MQRDADNSIIEFLAEHPFSTTQQIKSTGIIKNHTSLKKRLDSLEEQNRVKCLKFCNRYYVKSLPDRLVMLGIIGEYADKIILQLKKNQNLRQGSFYREIKRAHKKFYSCRGTKNYKARRFVNELSNRISNIKEPNERCLLKWFLSFELKAIMWELEFRKLQKLPFASVDDQKLIKSMLIPMMFFEKFLKEYDSKNSKHFLGIPCTTLKKSLDQMYSIDTSYYNALSSQKISFCTKILCYTDYLFYDSKKDASEFHHIKRKQSLSFESHIKKILDAKKENKIEERVEVVNKKLTSNMKAEKKKANGIEAKHKIQKEYTVLVSQKKSEIIEKITAKYQKKYEKSLSDTIPKSVKNITNMINSFHDENGILDVEELLHARRIEQNRLLYDNVDDVTLDIFVMLYVMRFKINHIPRYDADYKKMKKLIKKVLPEFVIA